VRTAVGAGEKSRRGERQTGERWVWRCGLAVWWLGWRERDLAEERVRVIGRGGVLGGQNQAPSHRWTRFDRSRLVLLWSSASDGGLESTSTHRDGRSGGG